MMTSIHAQRKKKTRKGVKKIKGGEGNIYTLQLQKIFNEKRIHDNLLRFMADI